MTECCRSASPVQEVQINDRHSLQSDDVVDVWSAKESARLLGGQLRSLPQPPSREDTGTSSKLFHTGPPSAAVELRELLVELGRRQEDLFKTMMQQQEELRNQLLELHTASRANIDATGDLQRSQESFLTVLEGTYPLRKSRRSRHSVPASEQSDMKKPVNSLNTVRQVNEPTGLVLGNALGVDAHLGTPSAEKLALVGQKKEGEEVHSKVVRMANSVIERPSPADSDMTAEKSRSMASKCSSSSKRSDWRSIVSSARTVASGASNRTGKSLRFHAKNFHASDVTSGGFDTFLRSKEFEMGISMAIFANAFVIFWEGQFQGLDVGFNLQFTDRQVSANQIWPGAETIFSILEWCFGALFAVEMLVKLAFWRQRYIYDTHGHEYRGFRRCEGLQLWNVLDFFCVAVFVNDKIFETTNVNPQLFRMLRLFRLTRLVRFLRFLESFDHLYVMTTALSALSKVLAWAVLLVTVLLLICDLFLVQILQATYFHDVSATDLTEDKLKRHQKMFEYFGTSTRCMLSMFEITLGNWPPVARLLTEEVSQWFTLIMVLHKLTIGFAVIGVINGIILQETFKVVSTDDLIMYRQKKRASQLLRGKMSSLFHALDSQGDGKLGLQEFGSIGEDRDIKLWLASLDLETDDLPTLFSLIDMDSSGYITCEELIARMPRVKGAARAIDVLSLMQKLNLSDLSAPARSSRFHFQSVTDSQTWRHSVVECDNVDTSGSAAYVSE